MLDPETVPPSALDADALVIPDGLDLTFGGFGEEAFAILERLRAEPHIEQYRKEKEAIRRFLTDPFKRYRDDLVVNWVLPNRLDLETERNVFSRLLKNDFGAGGCHHHLWMAFYRPGLKRLTDVQLAHSIRPEGFEVSVFVGGYARSLVKAVRTRIHDEPARFLDLVNPLLQETYWLAWRTGSGAAARHGRADAPLDALPDGLLRADDLWLRARFPRAEVVAWRGALVHHALGAVRTLWPVYRFMMRAEGR